MLKKYLLQSVPQLSSQIFNMQKLWAKNKRPHNEVKIHEIEGSNPNSDMKKYAWIVRIQTPSKCEETNKEYPQVHAQKISY